VAPRTLLDDRLVSDAWVALAGGRIAEVGVGSPPIAPTRHLDEGVLAPGLIDAQVNGAFGIDLVDADDAAWDRARAELPRTGVTAFVPTFITAPVPVLTAALQRARARAGVPDRGAGPVGESRSGGTAGRATQPSRAGQPSRATQPSRAGSRRQAPHLGARVLGIHVEGPFLAAARRGAHNAMHLADPSRESVAALLGAGGDALLYVTLAPERHGALAAIRQLTAAGVRIAIGHSDADDAQTIAAVDAGASLVTHLYNAQRPFGHRDPGVVGVALSDPRLTCGLIVDLEHVAPTAVRLAFAAAAGRIMLVSDAVAALGMPPGTYALGGQPTRVRVGSAPVRSDGTLAGSALRLDAAVANTIACGIDPAVALTAATRVPADALGAPDLGRLAAGAAADLVWLDEHWSTRTTWVAGDVVTGAERLPTLTRGP
jgi:N-acetylglucosamine-6-phosphate deacetylase